MWPHTKFRPDRLTFFGYKDGQDKFIYRCIFYKIPVAVLVLVLVLVLVAVPVLVLVSLYGLRDIRSIPPLGSMTKLLGFLFSLKKSI